MLSVVVVAGARPNFMKVAPLIRALEASRASTTYALVHTGQHYDDAMSRVFFDELAIPPPAIHLGAGSGSHAIQTAHVMRAFDQYLESRSSPPSVVVVVGDVNSTLACALVSSKRNIPTAHVEAGLRSGDRTMPEEINRIVADAVSDLLFVSEPSGVENLAREGVPEAKVRYVGNVMIDTLVSQLPAARARNEHERFGLRKRELGVVTLHRPANVDDPARLTSLVDLLCEVATDVPLVFPLHPRTEQRLIATGLRAKLASHGHIHMCAPLGYCEFVGLVDAARFVLTDSGGVQEETTFLGVPCVTLRTTTERPVTVTRGTNRLIGHDLGAARAALRDIRRDATAPPCDIPGWDGHAAERIVDALLETW